MQNKGFVKVFAVLLTLVCLFYLSFTFVTSREDKKIESWATAQTENWAEQQKQNGARLYAEAQVSAWEAQEKENNSEVEITEEMKEAKLDEFTAQYLKENKDEVVTKEEKAAKFKEFKNDYLEEHKDDKVWLGVYTLQECREFEIGLGLDLKGGLSVTLEVSAPEFLQTLTTGSRDASVQEALAAAQKAAEVGADAGAVVDEFVKALPEEKMKNAQYLSKVFATSILRDKVSGKNNDDVVAVIKAELASAVDNSYNVIRSRVDRFGVAQPNIQKLGGGQGRILVELPGVDDKERVISLLTRSSNLQFWEACLKSDIERMVSPKLTQLVYDSTHNAELASCFSMPANGIAAVVKREDKALVEKIIADSKNKLPRNVLLFWSVDAEKGANGEQVYYLYAVKDENADGIAPLQGDVVDKATAGYHENKPCVNMTMNRKAAKVWAEMTDRCAKKLPIAVVLDGEVYCAPVPQGCITGGICYINGDFTIKETQDLATVLCSGKMLVPLRDIESNIVGPSIGKASIEQGLTSFVVAFILLMLYMCFVYGLIPGMVANGALLLNLFFTLGILASFQAALTMAGIAGIVLTLGMAVDANVLIYERAKEELRAGKNVRAALSDGYKNAFSAIFDSNLTSIITGVILYNFGTGPIKGFAVTLIIGLLCSFFTAVFVTRVVYEHFHGKNKWMNLTFTTKFSRKLFNATKVNFMKLSKTVGTAFVAIAIAMFALFMIKGMAKSIEFTGGRNYVVKFEQEVSEEKVQKLVKEKVGDANVQVISYGTDGDQVRISTNYLIENKTKAADGMVEQALYDALKDGGLLADDVTFERFCNTEDDKGGSIKSSQKVDSSVAEEIADSAIISVILALIAIFIYVLVRFRNVAYSVGAIFALALDVVMIMGCYSLLHGVLPMSLELDQIFIGAILTAIGYSINDKVVIFDRIREYTHIYPKRDKYELFNASLNTTLTRTLNTSFTTLVVLSCVFILGGDSVRSFSFAMILGVVFGTLSSIFVAAPVAYRLVKFQANRKAKKHGK